MTDPTKQAATAKTARETIKAHVEALELWALRLSPGYPDDVFSRLLHDPSWSDEVHRVANTAGPLRALLDAPEGGVQRLAEAAEGVAHEVYKIAAACYEVTDRKTLWASYEAARAALAAFRASPESVGGSGVSDALRAAVVDAIRDEPISGPPEEIVRWLCTTRRAALADRDLARTQRDDAIRGITQALAERDALKAERDTERTAVDARREAIARDLIAERAAHAETRKERDALRAEVERLKAQIKTLTPRLSTDGSSGVTWGDTAGDFGPISRVGAGKLSFRVADAAPPAPVAQGVSERARLLATMAASLAAPGVWWEDGYGTLRLPAHYYSESAGQILRAAEAEAQKGV